jgi:hypothetical protein
VWRFSEQKIEVAKSSILLQKVAKSCKKLQMSKKIINIKNNIDIK